MKERKKQRGRKERRKEERKEGERGKEGKKEKEREEERERKKGKKKERGREGGRKEGEDSILLLPPELKLCFQISLTSGSSSFLIHQNQQHQGADGEFFSCINAFSASPSFKPGASIPTHSQLLLFAIVLFCEITMNIELVDTEFVSCEPLITTFSGKDLYVNLLCVLLFRDILLYIHYSLALTSWPIALMPEQSLSNTYIFSVRHTTTFLHLGRLDHTSALCMGTILHSKTTNKQKNVTDVALNRLQKGCWFTLWA